METTRIYTYQKCSTCRDATRWLAERGIPFEELPIRETPPTEEELKTMLEALGSITRLFNTSGMDYRAMGLKDTLPGLSQSEAFALLRSNGNLVKRPFLLTPQGATTGFKVPAWERLFGPA